MARSTSHLSKFKFKPGHIGGKAHPNTKTHGPKMPAAVKSKLRKRGK